MVAIELLDGDIELCTLLALDEKLEVVTGVNLPMILKLATARVENLSLRAAAELATNYGQKNITLASELLRTRARPSRQ